MKLFKSKCERKGHDWFPNLGQREFTSVTDICMRCTESRLLLPYGICLGKSSKSKFHPLSEHYDADGYPIVVEGCSGPR
jgi:hypothetical protein